MGLWNRVIKSVRCSSVVMEVVDARAPFMTRSLKLEKIIEKLGRKLVIVINKSDLAPEKYVSEAHEKIRKEYPCVHVSAKDRLSSSHLRKMISMFRPPDADDVKVCIVGYPNTGKSSIINLLAGKHVSGVAPVPGHTRGEQWIRISSSIMLYDTPGVVPIDDELDILKGFGRPEKMKNIEDDVEDFIKTVVGSKYSNISELYGLSDEEISCGDVLGVIARKRGLLMKGGVPDLKRAAQRVVNDWNTGKIRAFVD